MSDVKLTIQKRKNRHGKPTVAPFINERNVWDIPPEHWVPDVQAAIISAYQIGVDHANKHYLRNQYNPKIPREWEE